MGKQWEGSIVELATSHFLQELTVAPGAPGGMSDYRTALVPR